MNASIGPTRTPRNLNRAKACENCRKRKTKCDAKRPKCSQCDARSKPGIELKCEYPEVGRTRKQTLEESITKLEERIRELERLDPDEDSVLLHAPSSFSAPATMYSLPAIDSCSPTGSGSRSRSPDESLSPEPSLFATGFHEEISTSLGQHLLEVFVPHARTFGFFLNIPRYIHSTTLPLKLGDYSRPCPGLVCVTYLIGLHLSGATEDQENQYLSRALLHVSNVLSQCHPLRLLHGVQAEILLSTYFFRTGRILEGKYHLSAAVSLAMCAGLHKLRSANNNPFPLDLMGINGITGVPPLPDPVDSVEEGERINAFWTAFTLCNCWGVSVGGFSSMMFESYGSKIDTPWPLDMNDYEEDRIPPNYVGTSTVHLFLAQQSSRMSGSSSLAAFAQSSLLLERAANIASSFSVDLPLNEQTRYMKTFTSLDAFIDSFCSSLPPLFQTPLTSPDFVTAWTTHIMCRVATIKLHSVSTSTRSREKTLGSAESCLAMTRGKDLSAIVEVNPVVGILWRIVGQACVDEIRRLDAQARQSSLQNWPLIEDTPLEGREKIVGMLEELFLIMGKFAGNSKMIAYQLNDVRANYHAICLDLL